MTNIELPRDAAGREIPLDTVCMYDCNGDSISITRWCFTTRLEPMFSEKNIWIAIDKEGLVKDPALLHLTPPDNWDKLLEDLDNAAEGGDNAECLYSRREGVKAGSQCYGCKLYHSDYGSLECEYLAYADIADRIRKLRGEDECSDQPVNALNTRDNCNNIREVTLLDGSRITVCYGQSGEMVQVNADDTCDDCEPVVVADDN